MKILFFAPCVDFQRNELRKYHVEENWTENMCAIPVSEAEMCLRRNLTDIGLVTEVAGRTCVFLNGSNWWVPIEHPDALKMVCSAAGITNVPVNFATSASAFMIHINSAATMNRAPPIPRSVCIGISRLTVLESSDGESIMFETVSVPPRLLSNGLLSGKLRSLCLMPIINPLYPTIVKKGFKCMPYEYFCRFVTVRKEIDTIMWVVGNSILDPVSTARCVFLTGEGGTGKSSLCNYVYECLGKCAFVVDTSILYGYASEMRDAMSPTERTSIESKAAMRLVGPWT
ncbi:hypothetical protein FPV67DRAFT_1677020 [Lyophyllum atratum]|nr:hypothetical protein FPV67DRAFT_1677020 [Lyophyllum atratum]